MLNLAALGADCGISAVTSPDWPTAARKWQKFAGDEALPPVIVYGGKGGFEREACQVVGWRELPDFAT